MKIALIATGLLALAVLALVCVRESSWKNTGSGDTVNDRINVTNLPMNLKLESPDFGDGDAIPVAYTCDSDAPISPPLFWSSAPAGTVSFALIVEDPDIPQEVKDMQGIQVFDHWVLFNIPGDTTGIGAGKTAGTIGIRYTPPCPPAQYEPKEHRYVFHLYALDTDLPLEANASKQDVVDAMEGHVLDEAELIGRYARN